MPRVRVRKTDRGLVQPETYERAFLDISVRNMSLRAAAKLHGICHVTLFRYCRRRAETIRLKTRPPGYRSHSRVFSMDQERKLQAYIKRAADIYFGMSPKEVRKFAYELAKRFGCKYPSGWDVNKMAGKDWLTNFLQRNNTLSIRRPQATSMSRSTSFNKTNVTAFYNNLHTVISRYSFEAKDIWNMDETGTTTVQVPDKIIATKGKRQVGAVTSGERGTLVTVALAVNAQGNFIPPFFIFPRKKFQEHFVRSGPIGSVGSANSSGWMQDADFLAFLQHFARHTRVTLESRVLLLLDNHSSHLSVAAIDFCRSNGIVLVSFPPHCSHRLQPLDRSVFGPLKRYINTAADYWMRTHPGKTLTIYDVPSLVATALPRAATPSNITSGFVCTGICPFNPDIFEEEDFLPAFVTDRPFPSPVTCQPPHSNIHPPTQSLPEGGLLNESDSNRDACLESAIPESDHPAVCSGLPHKEGGRSRLDVTSSSISVEEFIPEAVRPFPKASPRKDTKRRRKRRSTAILTDSPVRAALEEEHHKRMQKQQTAPKKRLPAIANTAPTASQDKDEKCLVCGETYSSSLPGEVWVQCLFCQLWSHEACTEGAEHYICHNCDKE